MSGTAVPGRADVAFVSHEATLTGAPVGLVQLLGWLREHTGLRTEVVLLAGGPLADAFDGVAPVRTLDELHAGPPPRVLFLNSAFSAPALAGEAWPDTFVVSRIPELEVAFEQALPADQRERLLARADHFVVVADRVRRLLVERHGVDPGRVSIVHGSIPVAEVAATAEEVAAARRRAGIPPGVPVVGAVGVRAWRKGADLFVQLAAEVAARRPDLDVHFLWVGSHDESAHFRRLEDDVARAGLADRLHLVADVPRPAPFQAAMDVFVLTSREDPFPRVALEAAALARPIAAFDSGGVEELLAEAGTGVVGYGDVGAMADRVLAWLDDPAEAEAIGARLAAAVRTHHDLSVGAPKVLAVIERGLA